MKHHLTETHDQNFEIHNIELLLSSAPNLVAANACTELSPLEHGFMALSYGGGLVRYW